MGPLKSQLFGFQTAHGNVYLQQLSLCTRYPRFFDVQEAVTIPAMVPTMVARDHVLSTAINTRVVPRAPGDLQICSSF